MHHVDMFTMDQCVEMTQDGIAQKVILDPA